MKEGAAVMGCRIAVLLKVGDRRVHEQVCGALQLGAAIEERRRRVPERGVGASKVDI